MPSFQGIPPAVASFEVPSRALSSEPPKLGNLPFAPASGPGPAPAASPFLAPSPAAMPAPQHFPAAASNETMDVSLAAVLKGQSAADLGFDPNFIPAWITTKLPAADVRGQLPSGEVLLDLGTIIDGTDNSFRSVIAHGRRAFQVRIATSEVFQNLAPAAAKPATPTSAPAVEPSFAAPAPATPSFQSPFLPPGMQAPMASVPSPAPVASDWGAPPAGPAASPASYASPGGLSADQLFASKPADANPFMPGTTRRASTTPLMQGPTPAAPAPADPRQIKASHSIPFEPPHAPAHEVPPMAAENNAFAFAPPAPRDTQRTPSMPMRPPTGPILPAVRPASPAPATMANGLGIATGPDGEQMLLRALLGVSESLTAERVIELISRHHGVCACALMRGLKMVAHGDNSQPAQDFRTKAPEIANSIKTIADLTGIAAETLNITTGDRLITFCFQNGLTLGVLHTDREPPAGLREKLTLLSRELASMPSALA